MKKLLLTLVAVSVLFVIGCQENAITDPLSPNSPEFQVVGNETAVKNITNDIPVVIKFENELLSPYLTFGECFIVGGTINVDHKVFQLDPIPPNPQYRVVLKLCMDAEMNCATGYERNRWFIRCDTDNTIYFIGDEVFKLTKYYTVEGRSDRMQLAVNYDVTIDGVTLKDMKLRLPKYRVEDIINNF